MTKRYKVEEENSGGIGGLIFVLFLVWALYTVFHIDSPNKEPAQQAQPQQVEQVTAPSEDGCSISSDSHLVNQHEVGPIINLVKQKERTGIDGTCTVEFDIVVDGEMHHLSESETGMEQLESLCYYARERARKNLLLDLGGEFKTQSTVSCRNTER